MHHCIILFAFEQPDSIDETDRYQYVLKRCQLVHHKDEEDQKVRKTCKVSVGCVDDIMLVTKTPPLLDGLPR